MSIQLDCNKDKSKNSYKSETFTKRKKVTYLFGCLGALAVVAAVCFFLYKVINKKEIGQNNESLPADTDELLENVNLDTTGCDLKSIIEENKQRLSEIYKLLQTEAKDIPVADLKLKIEETLKIQSEVKNKISLLLPKVEEIYNQANVQISSDMDDLKYDSLNNSMEKSKLEILENIKEIDSLLFRLKDYSITSIFPQIYDRLSDIEIFNKMNKQQYLDHCTKIYQKQMPLTRCILKTFPIANILNLLEKINILVEKYCSELKNKLN